MQIHAAKNFGELEYGQVFTYVLRRSNEQLKAIKAQRKHPSDPQADGPFEKEDVMVVLNGGHEAVRRIGVPVMIPMNDAWVAWRDGLALGVTTCSFHAMPVPGEAKDSSGAHQGLAFLGEGVAFLGVAVMPERLPRELVVVGSAPPDHPWDIVYLDLAANEVVPKLPVGDLLATRHWLLKDGERVVFPPKSHRFS